MWKRTDNKALKALKAFKRGVLLWDSALGTFKYKKLGIYHYKRNPDKSLLTFED